jgi:hypothetical protein
MATRDVNNQTRLSAALGTLNPSTLAALNKEFVVDVRQFDRDSRTADLSALQTNAPNGDASDIGRALMSAVSDLGDAKAQAGVLLISDGRATSPGLDDAAQLALARSVPLWTWPLGGVVPRRDL